MWWGKGCQASGQQMKMAWGPCWVEPPGRATVDSSEGTGCIGGSPAWVLEGGTHHGGQTIVPQLEMDEALGMILQIQGAALTGGGPLWIRDGVGPLKALNLSL